MRRWLPHVGLLIGLGLVIYALFFAQDDTDRIRQQLEALEAAVEVKPQENVVIRAARVRSAFVEIFSKDVRFEVPELLAGQSDRKELVKVASSAPQQFRSAIIDTDRLQIDVDNAGETAVATGDVTLSGVRLSGEPTRDERTVSIRFDAIEGQWRIVSLTVSMPQGM